MLVCREGTIGVFCVTDAKEKGAVKWMWRFCIEDCGEVGVESFDVMFSWV